MLNIHDKRDRAALFRTRLTEALSREGVSRSALARAIGVDRSTISQILTEGTARLPNAQVIGACATVLNVSADWLLGLSELPENASDHLATALSMTEAPRALIDEQIFAWHQEAAGYKIRHVPAGLPDMLKTPEMLRWEYEPFLGRTTEQAIGATEDRLAWMRRSGSDYEMAMPLHEMATFAHGAGYYAGLPREIRRAQMDWLIDLADQMYPKLRLFLYDSRRVFSAPITVFGPLLAVIYLGRNYLGFRDTERVTSITAHFDQLVREAKVPDRDVADHLRALSTGIA